MAMGIDYSSTELVIIWLTILIVIILAMALYVMRRKALSLLGHSDTLAERVWLIEDELEVAQDIRNKREKENHSLKSFVLDNRSERENFIDLLNETPHT